MFSHPMAERRVWTPWAATNSTFTLRSRVICLSWNSRRLLSSRETSVRGGGGGEHCHGDDACVILGLLAYRCATFLDLTIVKERDTLKQGEIGWKSCENGGKWKKLKENQGKLTQEGNKTKQWEDKRHPKNSEEKTVKRERKRKWKGKTE